MRPGDGPKVRISITSPAPVARVLASRATATFPARQRFAHDPGADRPRHGDEQSRSQQALAVARRERLGAGRATFRLYHTKASRASSSSQVLGQAALARCLLGVVAVVSFGCRSSASEPSFDTQARAASEWVNPPGASIPALCLERLGMTATKTWDFAISADLERLSGLHLRAAAAASGYHEREGDGAHQIFLRLSGGDMFILKLELLAGPASPRARHADRHAGLTVHGRGRSRGQA